MRTWRTIFIAAAIVGGSIASGMLAGRATPQVRLVDPAKMAPVVECVDQTGAVVAMIPNPMYEVPGDADSASGC